MWHILKGQQLPLPLNPVAYTKSTAATPTPGPYGIYYKDSSLALHLDPMAYTTRTAATPTPEPYGIY